MDETPLSAGQDATRKPYTKPRIQEVPLRPDEAVLGNCKTASTSGPEASTYSAVASAADQTATPGCSIAPT